MKNKKTQQQEMNEDNSASNNNAEIQAETPSVFQYNNVPPFDWTRNEYGLLNHVNYSFNIDGTVNWRAMIPNEYLVPNKQNFERRKQPVPKTIEGLEDRDLLTLLAGIKYLANLRGFTKVDQEVTSATESYVSVKTTICLIGNYETNNQPICFSDLADAATFNTNSFAKYYLNAIAANRGFVRAWRNALRLPIVAFDEIGETPKEEEKTDVKELSPAGPYKVLQKKLDEKNISFEKLKNTCIKKGTFESSDTWQSILDIQPNQIVSILNSLAEKENKEQDTETL